MEEKKQSISFKKITETVTARNVAEKYGIKLNHGGMCCCPFHKDKNPSMKVDKRFHCFGCGADGDAIDFVGRLFNLGSRQAAEKIVQDFALDPKNIKANSFVKPYVRQVTEEDTLKDSLKTSFQLLVNYNRLLETWEEKYAPTTPDEELNDKFVYAIKERSFIDYTLDTVFDAMTSKYADYAQDMREVLKDIQPLIKKAERVLDAEKTAEQVQSSTSHARDVIARFDGKKKAEPTNNLKSKKYEEREM